MVNGFDPHGVFEMVTDSESDWQNCLLKKIKSHEAVPVEKDETEDKMFG